ncbi:metallophosphoesterase [Ruminococcus sp.]|uniref:metallophosphoesterase family protein n=1 Tax=Ruminococcus sp. TaxID=41978 RepID=UPI0025DD6BE0|nr:metallophosphoesterase [Ruminococcus sp.]MBQ8967806.1 metallophosphoesterase [Ruminococcus sp.]
MTYITGDTHGDFSDTIQRFYSAGVKEGDTVIICGDFGFVWSIGSEHELDLKELAKEKYTILFVDGNHENFELLETYPVVDYCGGKAHKIADNIYHLMRGQIFEINGKTFFTFGGAYSIDKYMRTPGYSWWEQERPSPADYDEAAKNLEKAGYKVDYVLTHTIPESMIYRLNKTPDIHDAELTGYFEWLYNKMEFEQWFAGHWHMNWSFEDRFHILYSKMFRLE